jgi:hypothetical protein
MQIVVEIREEAGYLWIRPGTTHGYSLIGKALPHSVRDDTQIQVWSKSAKKAILDRVALSNRETIRLGRGEFLHKRIPIEDVLPLVRRNCKTRAFREIALQKSEETQHELHKLYLREERARRRNPPLVSSDIITAMDGSKRLWLMMLITAKSDFLEYHSNPEFRAKWGETEPGDLLDAQGKLRRGLEDVYTYVTAKGLLFDDDYEINVDPEMIPCPQCNPLGSLDSNEAPWREKVSDEDECPSCGGFRDKEGAFGGWVPGPGPGRVANLASILETLTESLPGHAPASPSLGYNLSKLRSTLARDSGDPKFIEKYCLPEDIALLNR